MKGKTMARRRAGLTALAAAALTASGWAGAPALAVRVVDGAPNATFVAVGDLNGDGKPDLAMSEATYPRTGTPVFRAHLFFQKDGSFAMPADRSLDLPTSTSGLLIGDFDGDGRKDLVVGLRPNRSIAIYPGAGGFGKSWVSQYGNDSGGASLAAGRISPGGADFMTGAAWRKWRGADSFDTGYFCGPKANDNHRSSLADLNWDGLDDVIFTTTDNRIRVCYGPFLSMGLIAGSEALEVVTLTSPHVENARPVLGQVLIGDVNADGQPDLIVGAPNQTLVYIQNSPIGFSDGAGPSVVVEGVAPLLAGDLDGDELCDLVLRPAKLKGMTVWRQVKGQPFSAAQAATAQAVALPREVQAAAAGDLDGDGRKEVVIALTGGGVAIVCLPGW